MTRVKQLIVIDVNGQSLKASHAIYCNREAMESLKLKREINGGSGNL